MDTPTLHQDDQIDLSWLILPKGHVFETMLPKWHEINLTDEWRTSSPRKNFIAASLLSKKYPTVALFHYLKALAADDYRCLDDEKKSKRESEIMTYELVLEELKLAIKLSPKNHVFKTLYATTLFLNADYIKALAVYREVVKRRSWNHWLLSNYFEVLVHFNLKHEINSLIEDLKNCNETGYAHWLNAWLLYKKRDWQGLITYHQEHQASLKEYYNEFYISPYLWMGYAKLGRFEEALEIQYYDPYATMHDDQFRSILLLLAKKYEPLLEEVTKDSLADFDRYFPHFYLPRAEALRLHGRFDEALLLIDHINYNDNLPYAFAIKSAIKWQQGEKDEALTLLQRFKESNRNLDLVTYLTSVYKDSPLPPITLPMGTKLGPLASTNILWGWLN